MEMSSPVLYVGGGGLKKRYKLPYSCIGITITREGRGPDGPVSMETPAILEPAYGGTVADVSSSSPHVSLLLYQNIAEQRQKQI